MHPDDTVCYCFRISRRKLETFARLYSPRVASQLSECGGAGTGCGWCVPILKQLFRRSRGEDDTGDLDRLTPAECASLRADYVRSGKGTPAAGAIPLPDERV